MIFTRWNRRRDRRREHALAVVALREACSHVGFRVAGGGVRHGSFYPTVVPLAGLVDAGLTADMLLSVAAAERHRDDRRVPVAIRFVELVAAGADPVDVQDCHLLGPDPSLLRFLLPEAAPSNGPRVFVRAFVRCVADLSRTGRLPGPDDLSRGWTAWVDAVLAVGVLLVAGATPTVHDVFAWEALGSDMLRAYAGVRPVGEPDPDGWLREALPWAAAGFSPAEAIRLQALPPEHPDRPDLQDLAVLAALARTGGAA